MIKLLVVAQVLAQVPRIYTENRTHRLRQRRRPLGDIPLMQG
jgi:hypothetical protein